MSAPPPRADRLGAAILICFFAFLCFTLIDSTAKWLASVGIPVLQVVFIRYAGHFLAALIIFAPSEGRDLFASNAPKIQLARGFALLGSTVFNFLALTYLPLTMTTAIFFATPVVVSLLAVPMLGEKIGIRRFMAILVGFSGVLIITQPWGVGFHWSMLSALAALVMVSLYYVLTRMIAGVDTNPTGQVISSGLPTLVLLPFVLTNWVWPETPLTWVLAIMIGGFAALGHSALTVGYRYAPASTLAPVVYVQVIYAGAISWIVFSTPPDGKTILGTAVIAGAGLYIWLRERALRRPALPTAAGSATR